jgi:heptosyltransferase II
MFNFSKILIIHTGGIGDLVMFIPALKILRKNFPKAEIDLFVAFSLPAGDLLRENDLVNNIFKFSLAENNLLKKAKFIYKLRKKQYDLIVMPSGVNSLKGGILSILIGAKTRLGEIKNGERGLFYTHKQIFNEQKHMSESNAELLRAVGVEVNYPLPLPYLEYEEIKKPSDKNLIGFHPGAGRPHWFLLWDKENFIELGKRILENYKDAALVIFGGLDEKDLCEEVKKKIGGEVYLAIGWPLRRAAALMDRCQVFVVSDSGLGHVASTTRANVISIFGPSSVRRSAPVGPKIKAIQGKCYHFNDSNRVHNCLKKITVDSIFNEVKNILKNGKTD